MAVNESMHDSVPKRFDEREIELRYVRSHTITCRPRNLAAAIYLTRKSAMTEAMPAGSDDAARAVVRRVKLVTVHGTGSGDSADKGHQWWQHGSSFQQELAKRLHLDPTRVEIVPFHWQLGPNSEIARLAAGRALYELLKGYDKSGEDYYLIGHSHGGSVIHDALLHSVSNGRRFERLKSWCTIGTPFLDYRPTRFLFSRLGTKGLTLYTTAMGSLLFTAICMLAIFFNFTPTIQLANEQLGASAFSLYFGRNIVPIAVYGIIGLVTLFAAERFGGGWYSHKHKKKVAIHYGDRWLGLWHSDDEAISALSNVRNLQAPIVPPTFLMPVIAIYLPVLLAMLFTFWVSYQYGFAQKSVNPDEEQYIEYTLQRVAEKNETLMHALRKEFRPVVKWGTFELIDIGNGSAEGQAASPRTIQIAIYAGWLLSTFLFGAFFFVATAVAVAAFSLLARGIGWPLSKAIDNIVWSSVREQAWGSDRRGAFVGQIGTHPPQFDEKFAPLPDAIAGKLSQNSEKSAILTLHKVRELLGMLPNQKEPVDIRAQLSQHLTWRELIHTTYFDLPEFVNLAAYGLHRAGLADLKEEFWQDASRHQVQEWYDAISAPTSAPRNASKAVAA